ncbi:MAG TPA: NUDIX domain-containing protein [Acidimicrobiia bacterium]|nr:NUDIX domain-containing protein [Acidimicrobiia bacterium]
MVERRDRVVEWAKLAAEGENPAVPAATVVLVRDGDRGVEALMVRKDSKVAFGGMWVFPGGRVDDDDHDDAGDDLVAARRAAAREAEEETGLTVRPDDLEWISFWIPPPQTPRRFATWFFLAAAPSGDVVIDDGEIREHRWLDPAEALALRDQGEIELAPPTWVTLHWLLEHPDVAACVDAARRVEPMRFETRLGVVDGGAVALWEGDAGYEAADADAPGARHRLWLLGSGWRYERSGLDD